MISEKQIKEPKTAPIQKTHHCASATVSITRSTNSAFMTPVCQSDDQRRLLPLGRGPDEALRLQDRERAVGERPRLSSGWRDWVK